MGFKFMLAQALGGAAAKGSEKLADKERRAETIIDRATERFMNKHDDWDRQFQLDKRKYQDAYNKLKGLDLDLDKGQIEMILLGGPDGATEFLEAYKEDKTKAQYDYLKNTKQPAVSEAGVSIDSVLGYKPPEFSYDQMNKQKFLKNTFQRSDDYLAAKEKDDFDAQAFVGLGIKKASSAYAQGLNPYPDVDKQLQAYSQTEAGKYQTVGGFDIPASFIQSGVRSQLIGLNIIKPEQVEGQLGEGTGWKAPSYDAIPTDVLIAMEESIAQQETQALNQKVQRLNIKHKSIMHPLELKKITGDLDQQTIDKAASEIDLKLKQKDLKNADEIADLVLREQKANTSFAENRLEDVDIDQEINNAGASYAFIKNKLIGETDPTIISRLTTQLEEADGLYQSFTALRVAKNLATQDPVTGLRNILLLQNEIETRLKVRYGFGQEDIVTGGAELQKGITMGGTTTSTKFFTRNESGVEKKIYEGTPEFTKIQQKIQNDAMSFLIKSYGNIASDGTYTPKIPNQAYDDYFNITRNYIPNINELDAMEISSMSETETSEINQEHFNLIIKAIEGGDSKDIIVDSITTDFGVSSRAEANKYYSLALDSFRKTKQAEDITTPKVETVPDEIFIYPKGGKNVYELDKPQNLSATSSVLTKITPQTLDSETINSFLAANAYSIDRRFFSMIDKGLDPNKYSLEDFTLFNTDINSFKQKYPDEIFAEVGRAQDYGQLQRPSFINVPEEEKQKMRFKLLKQFLSLNRTDRQLRMTNNLLTAKDTGFEN